MIMKNDIILCLVGESGCGKTTVAVELEKQGFNIIHSFTTRKAREKNEWGHTFVDEFDNPNDLIAYTFFNNNHYWATKSQYAGRGLSVYVIDPAGVESLRYKVDVPIISVYLKVDTITRKHRLVERDGVTKAEDRMLHDKEAFSAFVIDWIIDAEGYSVKEVVAKILEIIPN